MGEIDNNIYQNSRKILCLWFYMYLDLTSRLKIKFGFVTKVCLCCYDGVNFYTVVVILYYVYLKL